MAGLELCHIFMMTGPDEAASRRLKNLGLQESYRRDHPGQGTANICYCFENAFLELLWVTEETEAKSPPIARTGLWERAGWRENGACPFGIALRGGEAPLPFPTWDYRPPYLPEGQAIPVANASDDPRQPFIFISPGRTRPDQWRDGRAAERQTAAGLQEISALELTLPQGVSPSPALSALQDAGVLTLGSETKRAGPDLILTVTASGGRPNRQLALPAMQWLREAS